ncbi:hypothetical protein AB0I98_16855 [Streptomyces sp. NPDC050211]|uniref:hypothetical protein n=1 Tax=Streptomyces sp. NPDC050211 TaxID=3154932 RepID=UPI0034200F50
MTDETEQQAADDAGGEDEAPGRIAGVFVMVILVGIAVLMMKAVMTFAPYVAYFVAGVLVTVGVQKARARWGRRGDDSTAAEEEAEQPDIAEALRRLVGDDRGVLLTRLRDGLKLPDTKAVKQLLDADGIPWKPVRTSRGNGPGVHVKDIPPAPSPAADVHESGCCCRSGDNGNSNNGDGEGIRVEAIGDGGRLVPPHPALEFLVDRFFAEAEKSRGGADPGEARDR